MKTRTIWSILLIGASSFGLMGAPAMAQEAPAANAGGGLNDIIVTAQRRAQNVQDVPISVTTITADALTNRGALDMESLALVTPGLSTGRQVSNSTFFLRGVGSNAGGLGTESPVALYIDDVYILGGASTLFEFNNIASVEVLKGPQGTLFGRNATGGVIHVHTRDPGAAPELDADLGYANYNTTSGNLYASTPITQTLFANLALHGSNQEDGWGHNLNNGEDLYHGWDWGARAKLLWEPSDDTRVRLTVDRTSIWSQTGLALHPQPGTFIFGCSPATAACRVGYEGFYNGRDLHAEQYLVPNPGQGVVTMPALRGISDYYTTNTSGVNLKWEQNLGFANFVSISSWRRVQSNFFLDQDGGPVVTSDSYIKQRDENYSQEFQLLSQDDSPVDWILGLYFLHDTADYNPYQNKGASRGNAVTGSTIFYYGIQDTDSIAAFAQATAPIIENWNLTLGIRGTEDSREVSAHHVNRDPSGAIISSGVASAAAGTSLSQSWPKVTFRASLDHPFTDDVLGYVSFNRGFKSGVYNFLQPPAGVTPGNFTIAAPANPEVLDAWEVGLKSEWFDHTLRVNASAFLYNYTDLQVTSIATGITNTINAGKAEIKGVELELTWAPTANLVITSGLSVQHGEYTEFPGGPHNVPQGTPGTPVPALAPSICTNPGFTAASIGGTVSGDGAGPPLGCDLSGNDTIRTPPVTFALGITYDIPTSMGDWSLGANWTYTDSFFWEPDASVESDSSNMVNANVMWTSPTGHFDVTLWGKNLLNEEIYAYANNTGPGKLFAPAAPVTYGIRLGTHWGG